MLGITPSRYLLVRLPWRTDTRLTIPMHTQPRSVRLEQTFLERARAVQMARQDAAPIQELAQVLERAPLPVPPTRVEEASVPAEQKITLESQNTFEETQKSLTADQTRAHLERLGVPLWLLETVGETPALEPLPEEDVLPLHWSRAKTKLEPLSAELGLAVGIVQAVYAVALSSGKSEFILCLWEIGAMLGVSSDYVGRLLKRYKGKLRRLAFWGDQYASLSGHPVSLGTLWRLDLERDHSHGLRALGKVRGDLELFRASYRDLESDIYTGHTRSAHLERVDSNPRGSVRGVAQSLEFPTGEGRAVLEHAVSRARGEVYRIETDLSGHYEAYDVLEAVRRTVGRSVGEHLGWVRQLGARLSSVLGGVRDLRCWYGVAWAALRSGAVATLEGVLQEVLVRGADAEVRNRSAVILRRLEGVGFWDVQ